MNDYVLLKKSKLDDYYKNDNSSKFLVEFNQIFNKIPHIYSEIFLKLFENRFKYFQMFENSKVPVSFSRILQRMFYNMDHDYDMAFFSKYLKDDFDICFNDINDQDLVLDIVRWGADFLSSDIEIRVLMDIVDKNINNSSYYDFLDIYNFSSNDSLCMYEIIDSYMISKVLVKVIKILNLYNDNRGSKFYELVRNGVLKFRTWDMVLDNVLDIYDFKYRDIISEDEFKILVYLIGLSHNGEDIDNSINYNILKIFDSLGYDTSMRKIIDYKRGYDYLEVCDNRYDNSISLLFGYRNSPVIYDNVSECLEILFSKYYDDYNFIVSKDKVLRYIFYLYMRNVNLYNKLLVCTNYKMWEYEWDSIKRRYEVNYLEDSIIESDDLDKVYINKLNSVSSGLEFEIFLEELFCEYGYDVLRCGKSGDQGGDLLIDFFGDKYVIQAKFYSGNVGNDAVCEVVGSLKFYNASYGCVITNSSFTKGSLELAYVNDIILIDGNKLYDIIGNLKDKNRYKNRNVLLL